MSISFVDGQEKIVGFPIDDFREVTVWKVVEDVRIEKAVSDIEVLVKKGRTMLVAVISCNEQIYGQILTTKELSRKEVDWVVVTSIEKHLENEEIIAIILARMTQN